MLSEEYEEELQGTLGLIYHDTAGAEQTFFLEAYDYLVREAYRNVPRSSGGFTANNAVSSERHRLAMDRLLGLKTDFYDGAIEDWVQKGLDRRRAALAAKAGEETTEPRTG
jgi:hypothetical protein